MTEFLPSLNAILNTTSAVLLVTGRAFIRSGNRVAHRRSMISAFVVSCLFLISYLTYHAYHGTTAFTGEGWIRPIYFAILTTHTLCAVAIVPLVIVTLRYGLRSSFSSHTRIARWTYPIWLYVSITGVIVYLMLYHLH